MVVQFDEKRKRTEENIGADAQFYFTGNFADTTPCACDDAIYRFKQVICERKKEIDLEEDLPEVSISRVKKFKKKTLNKSVFIERET